MGQLSFASLTPKNKSTLRVENFLEQMKTVIPWAKIYRLIKPYYYNNKHGRPALDLDLMIKIYCLQQWYNLGDLAMEEAIYDRRSFAKFLDLDLMNDVVPDETTILKFRHLPENKDLCRRIFKLVNCYLTDHGLMVSEGTIVDATIINSSSSTKNKEKKRDPEMSSTRKNNVFHFGMKAHVGVDANSEGLVHSCAITTAKRSDKDMLFALMHGQEHAVFGDKGYVNMKDKHMFRQSGLYWGILDRGSNSKSLSTKQKKRNHQLSRVRGKGRASFYSDQAFMGT